MDVAGITSYWRWWGAVEQTDGFARRAGVGDGSALSHRRRRRSGSARRRADTGGGRAGIGGCLDCSGGVLAGGFACGVPTRGGPARCGCGDLVRRRTHLLRCSGGRGQTSAIGLARGPAELVVLPADAGRASRDRAPPFARAGVLGMAGLRGGLARSDLGAGGSAQPRAGLSPEAFVVAGHLCGDRLPDPGSAARGSCRRNRRPTGPAHGKPVGPAGGRPDVLRRGGYSPRPATAQRNLRGRYSAGGRRRGDRPLQRPWRCRPWLPSLGWGCWSWAPRGACRAWRWPWPE